MATYRAGELLSKLLEEAVYSGQDVTAVEQGFRRDNSFAGSFNPNLTIEVPDGTPLSVVVKAYAGTSPRPGQSSLPTGGSSGSSPSADPVRSTTSSSSGSTTSYPVEMLDSLIGKSQRYVQRGDELVKSMGALSTEMTKTAAEGATAALDGGAAAARAISAQGEIKSQRNDFTQNVLQVLGVDINDREGIIRQGNVAAAKAFTKMTELQPRLDALRSVPFSGGNIVGWLKAQFALEGAAQDYNAAEETYNSVTRAVTTAQEISNRQLSLQPGISTDAIKMEATAQAEAELAKSRLTASRINMEVRSTRMAALSTELSFNGQQFSNQLSLVKLFGDRTAWAEKQGEERKQAMDLEMVNIWRDGMKLQRLSPEMFKLLPAAERLKMMEDASRTSLDIADTPGKSVNKLIDYEAFSRFREDMPPQGRVFLDDLVSSARARATGLQLKYPKLKQEELFQMAVDQQVEDWRAETKNRTYDKMSSSNPLRMNPSIYAAAPSLKDNPIAKFILAGKDGGAGLAEKDVLRYAGSLVSAGEPVEAIAAAVGQFAREGFKHQATAYRLSRLGFKLTNAKTEAVEYPVDGDQFGLFERMGDPRIANSSTINIQLFNEASLSHFLTLQEVASRTAQNRIDLSQRLTSGEPRRKFGQPNPGDMPGAQQ